METTIKNRMIRIKRLMILKPRLVRSLMPASAMVDETSEKKITGPITPEITVRIMLRSGVAMLSVTKLLVSWGSRLHMNPHKKPRITPQTTGSFMI